MTEVVLNVENLRRYFNTPLGVVKAVDGCDFSIRSGETFGLVGESGSGKSTAAYVILGIYPPTDGKIFFKRIDLSTGVRKRPKSLKKEIQIVFQDPGSSLNPKRTVQQILDLPLRVHGIHKSAAARMEAVQELLLRVELPEEYMHKYPKELGGGEKQRVAIARALATNPSFMVLDEPTSALDVSTQAKLMNMLQEFQRELNISYLFITHNLILMRNVASRVAIMYLGKICEEASASEFFRNPMHPYTKMLLSSIPVITKEEESLKPEKTISRGEIPSPVNVPPGCSFHPRCPEKMKVCTNDDPLVSEVEGGHTVRCHLYK